MSKESVTKAGYDFPALSPKPRQFLAKDILLLGAAIYTADEVLKDFYTNHATYTKNYRINIVTRAREES